MPCPITTMSKNRKFQIPSYMNTMAICTTSCSIAIISVFQQPKSYKQWSMLFTWNYSTNQSFSGCRQTVLSEQQLKVKLIHFLIDTPQKFDRVKGHQYMLVNEHSCTLTQAILAPEVALYDKCWFLDATILTCSAYLIVQGHEDKPNDSLENHSRRVQCLN